MPFATGHEFLTGCTVWDGNNSGGKTGVYGPLTTWTVQITAAGAASSLWSIAFDGGPYEYTSDASPTTGEIANGLKAAVDASADYAAVDHPTLPQAFIIIPTTDGKNNPVAPVVTPASGGTSIVSSTFVGPTAAPHSGAVATPPTDGVFPAATYGNTVV